MLSFCAKTTKNTSGVSLFLNYLHLYYNSKCYLLIWCFKKLLSCCTCWIMCFYILSLTVFSSILFIFITVLHYLLLWWHKFLYWSVELHFITSVCVCTLAESNSCERCNQPSKTASKDQTINELTKMYWFLPTWAGSEESSKCKNWTCWQAKEKI